MSYGNLFEDVPLAKPVMTGTPVRLNPHNIVFTEGIAADHQLVPVRRTTMVTSNGIKSAIKISEYGTEHGKKIADLADVVVRKTTTGKMGDFGEGITQILALTSQVNIGDLNVNKKGGWFGGITNFLKKKKVEVISQFESTSDSIAKVATDLSARTKDMEGDNDFLDQLYESNLEEYHGLDRAIAEIGAEIRVLGADYEVKKAQAEKSTDQFFIQEVNELEQRIKLWEKQVDRLKRLQQIALLTAPEIRQIQAGNAAMTEKFNDLINTTIPAWKKQLSMTILKLKQKENAELGNQLDDKTNEFFRKAAELNGQNAIAVAKASERSVVDMDTLEFMQKSLIDSVHAVKDIQAQGRIEREAASNRIDVLRNEMKTEMLSWSNK
jgi:uncharacterized protein YaaN involved in tellurite resistance